MIRNVLAQKTDDNVVQLLQTFLKKLFWSVGGILLMSIVSVVVQWIGEPQWLMVMVTILVVATWVIAVLLMTVSYRTLDSRLQELEKGNQQ